MLNELSENYQVYLVTGYTDLRRSIDGLATSVQARLELDSDYAVIPDFDTYGINNWIDVLPDELRQRLVGFPEVYLKAEYFMPRKALYRTKESTSAQQGKH